ncbi:MAG: hypothetical protein RLZZ468_1361 [Cyanobacteriota bacterium]
MNATKRPAPLQLPDPRGATGRRRRRRPPRWRRLLAALALTGLGVVLLVVLLQLPERFDTVLLLSNALANLIGGVQQLLLGVGQLLVLALLVALALGALLLVIAGVIRLARALAPAPSRPRPGQRPAGH